MGGCEIREVEDGEVEDGWRRFEDGDDVGGGMRSMKIGRAGLLLICTETGLLHCWGKLVRPWRQYQGE